jgi:DNA-binding HxlR family transcriptional regulator
MTRTERPDLTRSPCHTEAGGLSTPRHESDHRAFDELRQRTQDAPDRPQEIAPETFLERMLSANHLLHGDWITDVLLALSDKPLRYTDLLDRIRSSPVIDQRTRRDRHVHPKILVNTLRRMEDDGLLVRREDGDQVPRSVCYTLTQAGMDLLPALAATVMWCERHKAVIELAERRAADRHAS